jgi:hypothetical protein
MNTSFFPRALPFVPDKRALRIELDNLPPRADRLARAS